MAELSVGIHGARLSLAEFPNDEVQFGIGQSLPVYSCDLVVARTRRHDSPKYEDDDDDSEDYLHPGTIGTSSNALHHGHGVSLRQNSAAV